MRIDGRGIAREILDGLAADVTQLKTQGITPTLAVILVGDDPASVSYITQKKKAAEAIGAEVNIKHLVSSIKENTLKNIIESLNADPNVHGIIIQRPVPKEANIDTTVLHSTVVNKDVDGFVDESPFVAPVALAVVKILEEIHKTGFRIKSGMTDVTEWLRTKNIVIVGRGETAGRPIADYLSKILSHVPRSDLAKLNVIHSKTANPEEILREADIIISCTGKRGIVTKDTMKPGAILIGVGIGRDDVEKLQGDYDEEEIKDIASYYTPTPGGVGPVNVACLMENVVKAAQNSAK